MAAEWRALTPEQQAPFVAETEVHKKRYETEKKEYLEKKKIQDAEDAANAAAQAKKDIKAAAALEKKKAKADKTNA